MESRAVESGYQGGFPDASGQSGAFGGFGGSGRDSEVAYQTQTPAFASDAQEETPKFEELTNEDDLPF